MRRRGLRPSVRVLVLEGQIVLRSLSDPGEDKSDPRDFPPALAVESDGLQGPARKSARDSNPGLAAIRRAIIYPRGERPVAGIAARDRVVQRSGRDGRYSRADDGRAIHESAAASADNRQGRHNRTGIADARTKRPEGGHATCGGTL